MVVHLIRLKNIHKSENINTCANNLMNLGILIVQIIVQTTTNGETKTIENPANTVIEW